MLFRSKIEEALRDFKRSLEEPGASGRERSASDIAVDRWQGRAPASAGWDQPNAQRATGTEGTRRRNPAGTPGTHVEDASGVRNPGAVDYTRPPENR